MASKAVAVSRGFSALLISSIFLSLIWAARAQPAVPCQAPLQWEGRTVEYDHISGRNIRAVVSYDSSNQRLRILIVRGAEKWGGLKPPVLRICAFAASQEVRDSRACQLPQAPPKRLSAAPRVSASAQIWSAAGFSPPCREICALADARGTAGSRLGGACGSRQACKIRTSRLAANVQIQSTGGFSPPHFFAPRSIRFFEYIYLYKDAVMYQIEQVTKLCSKISLSEPWDPYDIPGNSTYEDQYYIGGPGDQIIVQEWSDRKPARKLENWVGVYTVKDCYPVQETYTKNYSVTTSTRFFDLKLGISDPSVFIPPSTCHTAQSENMAYVC